MTDTLEGRFEMIVLHAALVFRRLRELGSPGQSLADRTFDLLIAQLDYGLREDGASDHTIARKIRNLGEAYLGRARAYDTAIEGSDLIGLQNAFETNFSGVANSDEYLRELADYAMKSATSLTAKADGTLLSGEIDWPNPMES